MVYSPRFLEFRKNCSKYNQVLVHATWIVSALDRLTYNTLNNAKVRLALLIC